MTESRRVFVTGLSALTACGQTLDETWDALLSGHSSIADIQHWDLSSWTHRLGGELKHFKPARMLPDKKLMKAISRQDVMGIHAAMKAIEHSGLLPYRETLSDASNFNDNTGVFVGSPGNKYYQQYDFLPLIAKTNGDMRAFAKQLFDEVHPMWLLRILPNNVLAYTGMVYGFKGINHNVTNHAVGGKQALLEAYHAIRSGQADRAVVVAYDVGTEPQALFYYEKLGVISAQHLKPFDIAHDGTVLAEGAAALVLESEDVARTRDATCYAEVSGGLSTTECQRLFSVEDDGASLATLMSNLLEQQQLTPDDIALLVAHGNGNEKSDNTEAMAIQKTFSDKVPVTAFKWAMGHTLCASGVLDTVLAIYALKHRCIPGIATLDTLSPACNGINATRETRVLESNQRHALVVNRGFSSMNTAMVLKACD